MGLASHELPMSAARRVARLARLALDEQTLDEERRSLSAVLAYVETLRELDLAGVEPLAHPSDRGARPAADEPGPALPTGVLMRLAPEADPPFVQVPKVVGDAPT
jgi:aspartyl-tRNA(Asn)/glutamyl-tRNA(Gln) amidotransferase subunit C